MMEKQIKAVSLISGGLDSMLATKLIQEQGIHVEGINFFTGFCVEGHTHAIRKRDKEKQKRNNALWVAEQLGIKLHIIDVIEEYKDVLLNPKYGYGANMNPCLDCKIFMVRKAKQWAIENGFDFIITGEVIGQRPMSQRKDTMPVVQKQSGIDDLLLRPLSAKNLPETKPEREGWVDRSKLLGITGRGRKDQIRLAKEYAIEDYASPAGGCCFLTDKQYSDKLVDLWQARDTREYEFDDIMLLKVGRHIRFKPEFKLIVGREEGENNYLNGYKNQFISVYCSSHAGPLTLIDGKFNKSDEKFTAEVLGRFTQGKTEDSVTMVFNYLDGTSKEIKVKPISADEIKKEWYI
ncbi:tRNA (5-methylaminomethyl-2-thiouridylate)-methyltransferase [Allofrancisella inopinata]|uniref:tRNA (5-methylaminomethyl-2-thiouridylate)-methyltransferase n=1 Tax=Allofrancisella inopinata TaxID=1085647 RepID=A0AAE6YI44_9GAMM|nr:tRNA (5-methylaminomethyl-2-thiouridylate)-methyltransferase [Allofrancisella inopinata]QIV96188.1 tRNA (5-methylaminomethyl-2-thiouridylate)-methyltransferase [Allofrancisella inopinata]